MVRFRIACTLPFPRDEFWRIRDAPSFFEFIVQDGLLKELKATDPQQDQDGWSTRTQYYCPANVDCPNMLRAVVGDTLFEVSDEQRWNDKERPCHLHFTIKPSFLSELSRTYGELSIESLPDSGRDVDNSHITTPQQSTVEIETETGSSDGATDPDVSDASDSSDMEISESPEEYIDRLPSADKSQHIVSGETKVGIPTLGWFVERAIVHNLRVFYRNYPSTIARFRQKLYREFADNDENVPVSDVVDRFLESERKAHVDSSPGLTGNEKVEHVEVHRACGRQSLERDDFECDEAVKPFNEQWSPTGIDQDLEALMQPS